MEDIRMQLASLWKAESTLQKSKLTDKEKEILTLRYIDKLTLHQIGLKFNVSNTRITQILELTIWKIKQSLIPNHWDVEQNKLAGINKVEFCKQILELLTKQET